MNEINLTQTTTWLEHIAEVLEKNRGYLNDLDAPIGDSDHGENMARGFSAVKAKLTGSASADIGALLKSVGMTLISTVGGASGPLYGTLFLQAGAKASGKITLSLADWTECLEAGLAGIIQRGKAQPGDKTMVDALTPALAALRHAGDMPLAEVLQASADAAKTGMEATTPLEARKGRASYLGERSVNHQDPGATSTWLILEALSEAVKS